jgi:V/A-type H+/Na+-transporting ATPase subunit I
MIIPMKHVTVFCLPSKREATLESLRKLGILHVHPRHKGFSAETQEIEDKIAFAEDALKAMPSSVAPHEHASTDESPETVVNEVLRTNSELAGVSQGIEEKSSLVGWYKRWGKVDRNTVNAIDKEKGICVYFLQIPTKELVEFLEGDLSSTVHTKWVGENSNGTTLCCITGIDLDLNIPIGWIDSIPSESLDVLQDEIESLEDRRADLESDLVRLSHSRAEVEGYILRLQNLLKFQVAYEGMTRDETCDISAFAGYLPEEDVPSVLTHANENEYAIVVEDVDTDDSDVPTLSRVPKWIRPIESLFSFFGIRPGYKELDSHWDAMIIMPILVALLIGDAGYGALYLIGTLIARRQFSDMKPEPFRLGYILSISCIVWGALTGNWFGSEAISGLPLLRDVVFQPIATQFDLSNQEAVKAGIFMSIKISFFVGLLHLGVSRIRAAVHAVFRGDTYRAITQCGWCVVVIGNFLLLQAMFFQLPTIPATLACILTGGAIICFFGSTEKNIAKRIAFSSVGFCMDLVGVFGDMLSYMRLFAVGFTAFILAMLSNMLLVQDTGIVLTILGVAIALFGHTLNLVLGILAILVHGFRLHLLEGSKHAEIESAGVPYQPLNGV